MEKSDQGKPQKLSHLKKIRSEPSNPLPKPIIEDSEEFDDIVFQEFQQKKDSFDGESLASPKRRLKRLADISVESGDGAEDETNLVLDEEEDTNPKKRGSKHSDDDEAPQRTRRASPKKKPTRQLRRKTSMDDFVVDDDFEEEEADFHEPSAEDDEEEEVAVVSKRREKDPNISSDEEKSEDEDGDSSVSRLLRSKKLNTGADLTPLRHKRRVEIKPSPLLQSVRAKLGKSPEEIDNDAAPSSPTKSVHLSPRKGRGGEDRDQIIMDLVGNPQGYKEKAMQQLENEADDLNLLEHDGDDRSDDFMEETKAPTKPIPPQKVASATSGSRLVLTSATQIKTSPKKPVRTRQTKLGVTLESLRKPIPSCQSTQSQGAPQRLVTARGKLSTQPVVLDVDVADVADFSPRPSQDDDPLVRALSAKYSDITQQIATLSAEASAASKKRTNIYNYSDSEEDQVEAPLNRSAGSADADELANIEKERKKVKGQMIVRKMDITEGEVTSRPKKPSAVQPIEPVDLVPSSNAPKKDVFIDDEEDVVVLELDGEEEDKPSSQPKRLKRKRQDEIDQDLSESEESKPPEASRKGLSSPSKFEQRRYIRTKIDTFFKPATQEDLARVDSQLSENNEYDGEFLKNSARSQRGRAAARERYREERDDDRDDLMDEDDDLADFIAPEGEAEEWSGGDLPDQDDADEQGSDDDDGSGSEDYTQLTNPFVSVNMSMKQAMEVFIQVLIMGTVAPDEARQALREEKPGSRKWYYTPAIKKVRDGILQRGQNIMASSAWQLGFEQDLRHFPSWKSFPGSDMSETCQACKRRNHATSYTVRIGGIRYDPNTFWDLKFYEINDFMTQTESIAPDEEIEEHIYQLGRFCHHRTSIYHAVLHFPFALLKKIRKRVQMMERDDPDADINTVVETLLDNEPWIDSLLGMWRQIQHDMEDFFSREAKE